MPSSLLAKEASEAVAAGYRAQKLKARPWFDIIEQVRLLDEVSCSGYKLDIDWNETLLDSTTALPVLLALDHFEKASLYETPILRGDEWGMRGLRTSVRRAIIDHARSESFPASITAGSVDGFVLTRDGVMQTLARGLLLTSLRKPFFLQMPGTGITTALLLQLAAVLEYATWPHVSAQNVFKDTLLMEPLVLSEGRVRIPDSPGLGVDVDEEALERFRKRGQRSRHSKILLALRGGRRERYYADADQLWRDVFSRHIPSYEVGVHLRVMEDDGSDEWRILYDRARAAPFSCG